MFKTVFHLTVLTGMLTYLTSYPVSNTYTSARSLPHLKRRCRSHNAYSVSRRHGLHPVRQWLDIHHLGRLNIRRSILQCEPTVHALIYGQHGVSLQLCWCVTLPLSPHTSRQRTADVALLPFGRRIGPSRPCVWPRARNIQHSTRRCSCWQRRHECRLANMLRSMEQRPSEQRPSYSLCHSARSSWALLPGTAPHHVSGHAQSPTLH